MTDLGQGSRGVLATMIEQSGGVVGDQRSDASITTAGDPFWVVGGPDGDGHLGLGGEGA